MAGAFESPSRDGIAGDWDFSGGEPIVGLLGDYRAADVDGLAWRDPRTGTSGLVTWCVRGDVAEIVSVHATPPGAGTGTLLMDAAEVELRRVGVRRVVLATTNDNLRALSFYARRGYRLVRVHLDAMDRVRRLKPRVPHVGQSAIPLRDLWELEKPL